MSVFEPDASEQRRLRRMLSIFRSLASHMAGDLRTREDAGLHFSGRLGAIGRAALVSGSTDVDLHCLVLDELVACAAQSSCCHLDGPDVRVDVRTASVLSLAMHELAVNSLKFGALCPRGGRLDVRWRWETPTRLALQWIESGVKMEPAEERARGFGCELVERLVRQELGGQGEMVFCEDGVHCTIVIPLSQAKPVDGC